MAEYRVSFEKHLAPCGEVIDLYALAGWLTEEERINCSWLHKMVEGSFLFLTLYDGEKLIGMGRAISDGASDAYLQDIFVRPDYQKKGLGQLIVSSLTERLKSLDIHWIALIGVPNSEEFYKKLNFKRMDEHVPMLYSDT